MSKKSVLNKIGAVIAVFCAICFGFGFILLAIVEQNTKSFWQFAQASKPSDIQKIEVQKTDPFGNRTGNVITISGERNISEFTLILKTLRQEPQSYRSGLKNDLKVKIWLVENRTIEFSCYTVMSQGKTVFVNSVWLKPSLYSFGNGEVEFPASHFYDWLIKNGIPMQ